MVTRNHLRGLTLGSMLESEMSEGYAAQTGNRNRQPAAELEVELAAARGRCRLGLNSIVLLS